MFLIINWWREGAESRFKMETDVNVMEVLDALEMSFDEYEETSVEVEARYSRTEARSSTTSICKIRP